MYMLIRLPVACLLIVIYTFLHYCSKKRLQTATSRLFELMGAAAIIHLVAAAVTEYTVNNRDTVPVLFNYVWHVIFLISISCVCLIIYFYLLACIESTTGKKQTRAKIIMLAVFAISVLGELVLPIAYIDSAEGSYSLGAKALSLYVEVIFVMIMMIVKIIAYRKYLSREKSKILLCSVGIFVIMGAIQIRFPYMLITDIAITLIFLGVMVNTEDSHLYISYNTGLYNELGCGQILQELFLYDKPFEVAIYVFLGKDEEIQQVMQRIQNKLPEKTSRVICGTIADNVLMVIPMCRFNEMARLPAQLPKPEGTSANFRYAVKRMQFGAHYTKEEVFEQVRDYKRRFEENAMQRDELTGLLRRNAFIRQVERIISHQKEFTFIMADLDEFKNINDQYGHTVGDQVLKEVARVLSTTLRSTDILCRMGGDEFAFVLLSVTDTQKVYEISHRIRAKLLEADVIPDANAKISISFGAKMYNKVKPARSFQEVYAEADAALYHAKYKGKSQLSFYEAT